MSAALQGARALITGGTGSFGEFAVGELLRAGASHVTVFSRDEYKQFQMSRRYREDGRVQFALGDVRDQTRLEEVMAGINLVVHAAAIKHVDACEANVTEAVLTNVLGAHSVIRACRRQGVSRAVNLSADKATMPSGVYGATKLLSERIFTRFSDRGTAGLRAATARYSNVLGSRGSVVEVFERQLRAGKPITVDPRMIRFVLTQDQVVNLVYFAFEQMRGGEVFIHDSPVLRIVDLAHAMVELCGGGTVKIEEGEARAGERYEAWLFSAAEAGRTLLTPEGYYVILPEVSDAERQQYVDYYSGARAIAAQNHGSETARVLSRAEVLELIRTVVGTPA